MKKKRTWEYEATEMAGDVARWNHKLAKKVEAAKTMNMNEPHAMAPAVHQDIARWEALRAAEAKAARIKAKKKKRTPNQYRTGKKKVALWLPEVLINNLYGVAASNGRTKTGELIIAIEAHLQRLSDQ